MANEHASNPPKLAHDSDLVSVNLSDATPSKPAPPKRAIYYEPDPKEAKCDRDIFNEANNIRRYRNNKHAAKKTVCYPLLATAATFFEVYSAYRNLLVGVVVEHDDSTLSHRYQYFYILVVMVAIQQAAIWRAFLADAAKLPSSDKLYLDGHSVAVLAESEQGRDKLKQVLTQCKICSRWRPPRCHHCRATGGCILGFDHFCTVLGVNINAANYKYFYLAVLYSSASCISLLIMLTYYNIIPAMIGTFFQRPLDLILPKDYFVLGWSKLARSDVSYWSILFYGFLTWLLVIYSFGTTFMTCIHTRMIQKGLTTLHLLRPDVVASQQMCRGEPTHPIAFEKETTAWQRAKIVLGSNPLLWLFPVYSRQDLHNRMISSLSPLEFNPNGHHRV